MKLVDEQEKELHVVMDDAKEVVHLQEQHLPKGNPRDSKNHGLNFFEKVDELGDDQPK